MTRDDMQIIVYYYIYGAQAKSVREDTNIQACGGEIVDFLDRMGAFVEAAIDRGHFDDNSG